MNIQIYETIRNRILYFEYPPGQILNEKVLAEEVGMSRTPIREVLNRLEYEQLVRVLPRTGTMISEIEVQKVMNVFKIRLEIEGLAGRWAAEQVTDDHLIEIEKLYHNCKKLNIQITQKELVNIDLKFRDIIYTTANNIILKQVSQYLYNLTIRLWIYIKKDKTDLGREWQAMMDEIKQTHEALSKRDPQVVEELRRRFLIMHIEGIKSKL